MEQALSKKSQGEDQDNTSLPVASTLRRQVAEINASPAITVLHLQNRPFFMEEETMMTMFGHQSLIAR